MVAVPAETPVTVPAVLTDAIDAADVDQLPPEADEENVFVAAWQRVATPVMVPATGTGYTVSVCVAVSVPQLLVTE